MKVVLGIRFSSWKGGRDEGCLGDPLFELESSIPARKADPQPIPPEKGGWNPAFQLEKRIPGQSLLKRGRDEGCLGIRFSSWNPAFQSLLKRGP